MCQTKTCSKCKEEKELSEFHKDSSSNDGHVLKCKSCIKEYSFLYNKEINVKVCVSCGNKKHKNSFHYQKDSCSTCLKKHKLQNVEKGSKKCKECKIEKELNSFSKNNTSIDKLSYKCKQCISFLNKSENSLLKNRIKQNSYNKKRFFYSRGASIKNRAKYLNIDFEYTVEEFCKLIARKWKLQKGICKLTGEVLTRDNCCLDHIIPVSKGGSFNIENLHWVTKEVNRVKGTLTIEELLILCSTICNVNT